MSDEFEVFRLTHHVPFRVIQTPLGEAYIAIDGRHPEAMLGAIMEYEGRFSAEAVDRLEREGRASRL